MSAKQWVKGKLRGVPGLLRVVRRFRHKAQLRQRAEMLQRVRDVSPVDPSVFVPKMLAYWKGELGIGDRTAEDWLITALNYTRYSSELQEIRARFGSLRGKRVLEVGCGWGTLLTLLAQDQPLLEACDVPPIHVEVTALRVPTARVRVDDARRLETVEPDSMDIVIEHDVFEHVGDYRGDTGPIGRTWDDKLQNLRALGRVLKPGGRGFLSTGNYAFPFNGEVQLWAVHWLPFAYQERYLKSVGLESDRYWLCTWDEMSRLFEESGLVIEEVTAPKEAVLAFRERFLHCLRDEPGVNAEFGAILLELMSKDPRFMPSWMIFFRKKTASV